MSEFQICSTSRSHSQIDATHVREGGGGEGAFQFSEYTVLTTKLPGL